MTFPDPPFDPDETPAVAEGGGKTYPRWGMGAAAAGLPSDCGEYAFCWCWCCDVNPTCGSGLGPGRELRVVDGGG